MLRKVRFEVVEATPEEVIEALMKYLHSIQVTEADRYKVRIHEVTDRKVGEPFDTRRREGAGATGRQCDGEWLPWPAKPAARDFFNSELGVRLVDQHVHYDESLPGFVGRMVIEFQRCDTRDGTYTPEAEGTTWAGMVNAPASFREDTD